MKIVFTVLVIGILAAGISRAPDNSMSSDESINPQNQSEPDVEAMFAEVASRLYPTRCEKDAREVEYVTVWYDISKSGQTKNVRIIDSTNPCFDEVVVKLVESFVYEPPIVNGESVERKDVEFTLTFKLK